MGKCEAPDHRSKQKRDNFFVNKRSASKTNIIDNNLKNNSKFFTKSKFNNVDSFFVKPEKNVQPSRNSLNRQGSNKDSSRSSDVTNVKKPFDKKKWRLQRYSKKYALQQWEDRRKKSVLQEYYRDVKDDGPKFDVQKIYEQYENSDNEQKSTSASTENENNLNASIYLGNVSSTRIQEKTQKQSKRKTQKRAHLEFLRIKEEKQKKKEEMLLKKAEKKEALKLYKKQKIEKFKKLNKKTKKGQPVMKARLELLLEQIQKSLE